MSKTRRAKRPKERRFSPAELLCLYRMRFYLPDGSLPASGEAVAMSYAALAKVYGCTPAAIAKACAQAKALADSGMIIRTAAGTLALRRI